MLVLNQKPILYLGIFICDKKTNRTVLNLFIFFDLVIVAMQASFGRKDCDFLFFPWPNQVPFMNVFMGRYFVHGVFPEYFNLTSKKGYALKERQRCPFEKASYFSCLFWHRRLGTGLHCILYLLPVCSSYLWVCFFFVIFTSLFYFLDSTYKWYHYHSLSVSTFYQFKWSVKNLFPFKSLSPIHNIIVEIFPL